MTCPACDAETVVVAVPPDVREHVPEEAAGDDAPADGPGAVAVCTNCLRLSPADGPAPETPDLARVSEALPADAEAAAALLVAASLLSSLARNREAVATLLAYVERRGADPALTIERLADDESLSPAVDLRRRYRQFEQLRD